MRRPTLSAALAAALILFVFLLGGSALTRADSIPTYSFTSTTAIPSAGPTPDPSVPPQIEAVVRPNNGIVPTLQADGKTQNPPLTILPDSHGFDTSKLRVYLGYPSTQDPNQQFLGLAFFGSGFQPGGLLHFALSVDKNLSNPPTLTTVTNGIPGVTIKLDQLSPPPPKTSGTPPPPPQTPEPISLVLWSTLAGAGLVRARGLRRRLA